MEKFILSTGAFVGAIGDMSATTGTCPASGAASGWCTGGTAALGSGDGMFDTPGDVAIDSTDGFFYVADTNNNRIEQFNLSTGVFVGAIGNMSATTGTCPASGAASGWCTGGTAATGSGDGMFKDPIGVSVDPTDGFFYVADTNNNRIEKFNLSTGAFVGAIGDMSATTGTCPASGAASSWCTGGTTAVGSGVGMFNGSFDVTTDATHGFLYVADTGNNRIQKIALGSGTFTSELGATEASISSWTSNSSEQAAATPVGGGFDSPVGIATDSNGYLYVADQTNNRVEKFVLSTGAFVGAIGDLSASTGSCPASGAATGWCTGGTFTTGAGDGMFNAPSGLRVDSTNGFLYVADNANNRIEKFVLSTGAFVGAIGDLSATTGSCPASGAATGWCAGGTFTTGTGDGMFSGPQDLEIDPTNGFLYVTDSNNYRVEKFVLATGAFVGAIGQLSATTGTCPASGVASTWCTGGTFAMGNSDGAFSDPIGVTLDSTRGFLYVLDLNNGQVSKINLSTGAFVGAIGGLTGSTGTCPSSGAANAWCTGGTFSDWFPTSYDVTPQPQDGMFCIPLGIAIDPTNGYLYVADSLNDRIEQFVLSTGAFVGSIGGMLGSTGTCPSSGAATTWCTGGESALGIGPGMFDFPEALTRDSAGELLISDTGNSRVMKAVP